MNITNPYGKKVIFSKQIQSKTENIILIRYVFSIMIHFRNHLQKIYIKKINTQNHFNTIENTPNS